ncbi:isochorismatase family protein [Siccirubricoccus sp. KC 17139]|uniref:Isochorismatase family protein n=1 Tax=Siccirubricoccus soli TaxID=2899147 RepID=A0ABT1D385_9PROT|nr:isochorismatase family protein [Siccirubricoccus soli]MCO6415455.1 isochorismatase family protein [Siccirubricoccus soli]MCP2681587.1 isochorismatase family protein [Siccirubricoccus soli]
MIEDGKTARELYLALQATPPRARFGFGRKAALVNVDVQCAYTRPDTYVTAYETDPRQIAHINALAALCRHRAFPVVWTYVAYLASGEDCGVWGTRTDTPDSLQNIKEGSPRAQLDPRAGRTAGDVVIHKRMASAFFETHLRSLLTFHHVDTVVVTSGSTSGCVRATVVDGLSCGFRMVVPEEAVADRHESPHFASLYDMALKYADVLPMEAVLAGLAAMPAEG